MEIKKIQVDECFSIKIANQIDELVKSLNYSPIWQTIGWNSMLRTTKYIENGIFIGVFEEETLKNFAIIEKRKV
jgi:hypothetical protein